MAERGGGQAACTIETRSRHEVLRFGAECSSDGVLFRLWAPKAQTVDVVLAQAPHDPLAMHREAGGGFRLITARARAGSLYHYRIDGGPLVPDPASRFQPDDVHGPSEVVDPRSFLWTDGAWRGRPWEEAVIYEMHVGAFSPQGTYAAAAARLPSLRDVGVTAVELMPIGDFPGRRNWGYDGVLPFAPDSAYGRPEDLKAFIQTAHGLGLMVFLDVVYNHFGPDGNYIALYAPQFFTKAHQTPWGDALNFDGPDSAEVRGYFVSNARYWLNEYHFDGLRLDAVHAIFDASRPHIVSAIAQAVAPLRAGGRAIHLVLENEDNAVSYFSPDIGEQACTAQWNDDIHHVLHRLLTGERDGYYADYDQKTIGLLGRCLTEGFAYQGEFSAHRGAVRGHVSTGLAPGAFVSFLQNHDQIGNRAFGERITKLASDEAVRAAMAILLLAPSPPLLFMGQEFGCSQPFLFFCDFGSELAAAVTAGRRREFARFPEFGDPRSRARIPDPNSEATFHASQIDWDQALSEAGLAWQAFYRDLLHKRHERLVPHLKAGRPLAHGYTVFGVHGLRAAWRFADGAHLVLYANLSEATIAYEGCTEELL
ncbi:MAG: malto-oligosyltrehalose trehalohydrolase, partial [Acidiferrobacter sp.]